MFMKMMSSIDTGRNELCWCGSGRKYKQCHGGVEERLMQFKRRGCQVPTRRLLKTAEQIEGIRESSRINIAVLDFITGKIAEGITTGEIDRLVYEKTTAMGGIPAPLDYEGFPKSVCTSINEEVCHGIPSDDIVLKSGDIVNVDCSTIHNGYFSDSSRMFLLGAVDDERRRLVATAKQSIAEGLKEVRPWVCLGNIGAAINSYVRKQGFRVVRDVGGHGVGLEFHEEPFVSYVTRKNTGMILAPGMVFTIEPMINVGTDEVVLDEENGWTIYTADGKSSAQWEVTVLVTANGYEVLTY